MGSVTIEGDLTGGSNDNSGNVASDGPIQTVEIDGSIVGSDGFQSGAVGSSKSIHSVTVMHDVTGGSGNSSGQIVSKGPLDIGSHQWRAGGGQGNSSGTVGSLGTPRQRDHRQWHRRWPGATQRRGARRVGYHECRGHGRRGRQPLASNSGSILAFGKLKSVKIHGSLFGGFNDSTGVIASGLDMGTVVIDGDINGKLFLQGLATHRFQRKPAPGLFSGPGDDSGAVFSGGKIKSVTVGGSLVGRRRCTIAA